MSNQLLYGNNTNLMVILSSFYCVNKKEITSLSSNISAQNIHWNIYILK